MVTVVTKVEISKEKLADLMVSAVEGNHIVRLWCDSMLLAYVWDLTKKGRALGRNGIQLESPWYASKKLWDDHYDFGVTIALSEEVRDDDDPEPFKVAKVNFHAALQAMANKCPRHFADLVSGNDDAVTADVFLQLAVFNEVRYG